MFRDRFQWQSLSEMSSSSQLLLGGISVFIGRGSLAQIYFVVSMESFFLMVSAALSLRLCLSGNLL